jgi:uncharacterized protein YerC
MGDVFFFFVVTVPELESCARRFRRFLQVLVQQSTYGHDSEQCGPDVVASATVSWKRGDDG